MNILKDIRVLEITEAVAGPYAASLLGDMGASVIKVERPEGDMGRVSGKSIEGPLKPHFIAINRNKRGICLDLRQKGASPIVRHLVEHSDIIISNYRKGVMERLGLGYSECQSINPKIIYCTISAFGQKGDYSSLAGSDTGIQAISGIMDSIGELEGPQMRVSFPLVDLFAASLAVQGILLGLYARQQGGVGRRIDVSLMNAAMALQTMPFTTYLITGEQPQRTGNQNPHLSPAGSFRTKDDKYISIATLSEAHWKKFCQAIGLPGLTEEERFQNNTRRLENRAELNRILTPILQSKTRGEWISALKQADILCSPVNTFADVEKDFALFESLSILKFNLMDREMRAVGNPIEMDGEYPGMKLPAGIKGQNTVEILEEIGYSKNEIQGVISDGIAFSATTD